MSVGEVVQESQNRACMSACSTHVRLSVAGSARRAVYALCSFVSSAGVSALIDLRSTIGRVSLPGTKCVPPVGGAGQPLGGSCANAFRVEKTVLEPANTDPPASAAALCRKLRRLGPPRLSCFIGCLQK